MGREMSGGYNLDIRAQWKALEAILSSSELLSTAIERARSLEIGAYYIGAGCIAQTVWNHLSGFPADYGIKDIDLVYYDGEKIDYQSEDDAIREVKKLYSDLGVDVDVKNQARVHLWYESHFGYSIRPYTSLESAINSWPTTATSIGVRRERDGELRVYAPFGLNDLFGKVVRANKAQITKQIYEDKVRRWLQKWPDLRIVPWES